MSFYLAPFKVTFQWGKDRRRRGKNPTPDDVILLRRRQFTCRRSRCSADYEFKLALFGFYAHLKVSRQNSGGSR